MANSFDPKLQEKDLTSKIVVGVERLSEVFRVLLWEKSKETGLSPIQIQILLFVKDHPGKMANVSALSKEFNLKKPTISDAVKVLFQKGYILKLGEDDARSYTISLSGDGKKLAKKLEDFDSPLKKVINELGSENKVSIYHSLVHLIYALNETGLIEVQRTCFGCQFYERSKTGHYCKFLKSPLRDEELRIDCLDFQKAG